MRKLLSFAFLTGLAASTLSANATKYGCVTAEEIPNRFYEFDNSNHHHLVLYQMKTPVKAKEFLEKWEDKEGSYPRGAVKKVRDLYYAYSEKPFIDNTPPLFSVTKGSGWFTLFPYSSPSSGFMSIKQVTAEENQRYPLYFDGVQVVKVNYHFCGKD